MDLYKSIFSPIGYAGPLLLFFLSLFILREKLKWMIIYLIGFFCNSLVNIIIKHIVRQPRPSDNPELINMLLNSGRELSFDKYGMPSGHAQSVFYSTIFIFMVTKNVYILFLYALISLITITQRYINKRHSLLQVFVGLIIGCIIGYFMFLYGETKIKGTLIGKKEDNAPFF